MFGAVVLFWYVLDLSLREHPLLTNLQYAMLAGYLPFDDDPANPEGDNINLLYKYIVSTPLTFPEYVTPHARDLLKRILVPEPRRRADLFEVARHSWLSEYSHVVGFITSSTTSRNDIANTTVPAGRKRDLTLPLLLLTRHVEDSFDTPLLARSASVREPTKTHTAPTTLGGLAQKQGQVDQPTERPKQGREKRRTVQVEYVAPQSSTARGDATSTSSGTVPASSKTRARGEDHGPVEVSPSGYVNAQPVKQSPSSSMPPPARPTRDQQRAASENVVGVVAGLPSAPRPNTGGSLPGARLPSRGNSYGQPAVAVVREQAQGSFSQPKGTQYTIAPNLDTNDGTTYGQPYIHRPIDNYRPESERQESYPQEQKGHRRSNTLGEKLGSIFGRNSVSLERKQEEKEQRAKRSHPPISMKQPIPVNNGVTEPRRSTESRRSTERLGFSRKNSNQQQDGGQRTSRRFSFIPASLQRTFSTSNRDPPGSSQSSDRRVSYKKQREDSRPRMGFGHESRSSSRSTTTESNPAVQDSQVDRPREGAPQRNRPPTDGSNVPTSAPPQQTQFSTQGYASQDPYSYNSSQPVDDYDDLDIEPPVPPPKENTSTRRQTQTLSHRPGQYPPGFNDNEDDSYSYQGRDKPATLQKHRRFTEAYENDHIGTSGPARRVMDFFRKRGKARVGE